MTWLLYPLFPLPAAFVLPDILICFTSSLLTCLLLCPLPSQPVFFVPWHTSQVSYKPCRFPRLHPFLEPCSVPLRVHRRMWGRDARREELREFIYSDGCSDGPAVSQTSLTVVAFRRLGLSIHTHGFIFKPSWQTHLINHLLLWSDQSVNCVLAQCTWFLMAAIYFYLIK